MRRRTAAFLTVVPTVVCVDQAVKLLVQAIFRPGQVLAVIPGFFDLVLWSNTGIAFGMLGGGPQGGSKVLLLGAVSLAAVALMVWLYYKESPSRTGSLGLLLVVGGAIGNAIDRLVFGQVVDFLYFHYGGFGWPAFNVADACITTGIVMIVLFDIIFPAARRLRAPGPV
jgi:signal peptidase II